MKYKQIREGIATKDRDNIILTIVLLFVIMVAYFYFLYGLFPRLIDIVIVVGVILLLPISLRRFYTDWTGAKDVIGNIEITSDRINSDHSNDEIVTGEIVHLELRQNFIKGKRYLPRDIIHNGLAEMKIRLRSGDFLQLVFLIENKEQFEYLGITLKEYYRKRIEVKETMFNSGLKTILLKPHWNIQDLQNLKKELSIDNI